MRASALVVVCLVAAAAAVALAAPVAASSVSAIREMEKAHVANLMEKYATAEWRADFTALVETASMATADPAPTASTGGADVGMCEVCTYVVENKAQHQPYLCRGLKDPQYQRHCVDVMESLMWWLTNEVYWLNYGCQRTKNSAVEWVRPCPAHALCSWIEHLSTRETFCPPDPFYPKPQ